MGDRAIRCEYCNKKGSNLKICGRCKHVQYCTKLCQTSDWKNHKQKCQAIVIKERRRQENEAKLARERTESGLCGIFSLLNNLRKIEEHHEANGNSGENRSVGIILHKMRKEYNGESSGYDSTGYNDDEEDEVQNETEDKSDSESSGNDSKTEEEADLHLQRSSDEPVEKSKRHICALCSSKGSSKKCSRCMKVYYCSRECQRQDWQTHKTNCKKISGEENEEKDEDQNTTESLQQDIIPSSSKSVAAPPPTVPQELSQISATCRKGSLRKATKMATRLFPSHKLVTNIIYVPSQPVFNFFPFAPTPPKEKTVFVAYMYEYHEDVIRHGVHLRDDCDNKSKVEFHLDNDDPSPFFSYSQVKPGGYICILNAAKHLFRDGSVGFRIDHPDQVKILDLQTNTKQQK